MKIVMIGQGGHSKVVRDIILSNNEYEIVGYLDDRYEDIAIVDNIYFGPISTAHEMINYFNQIKFVIAIGDNKVRKLIVEKLCLSENYYATLIHKTAVVSPSAKIGNGTVVMPNVVINADTQIGNHVIINTGSVVEHDNIVGDFVHISPHVTLTGSVIIEEGAHIGAAATMIPSAKVREWSIIGAGSVVINDIPPNCTAVGIPAKIINEVSY
ncbi:Putative acetyltransferase EpsM [Bacillus rhizoplanae]|uniref:Acetyltransferase EpsM n=1 Tax=Bacillus rhizoplanae TaxID=2880966 RepID=A0ABN8A1L2_9BACI|nr:acetyltransferase [Bacillus rhizoplanae]CAG9613435.1 Putative acetyltransferase EpsM [Bacillus rhizoplanae]